jgi:hypothetical protein
MTLEEFRQSLTATEPPAGLTLALAGLWWDAKGDWKRAHESAQPDERNLNVLEDVDDFLPRVLGVIAAWRGGARDSNDAASR